jgi:hypothetical protein
MAVKIALTEVNDLVGYLEDVWQSSFAYRSHGFFATPGDTNDYQQWGAGNVGTAQSAALINGDFDYGAPGGFIGDVDSIVFGDTLTGNASGYGIDASLTFDLSEATTGGSFTYAIYYLSNRGALDTFYKYLGEQGTEQVGSDANNVLYSFAGNDVLTGGGASDYDEFVYRADLNTTGWGNDTILDFVDGNDLISFEGYGWNDYSDFVAAGGSISGSTITYGSSTIDVAFLGSGTLDSSDLYFIA